MEIFWHSWLWVAFAVPIFYAFDSVLDVFFVDKKIYRNPVHATIISGLFSAVCLLLVVIDFKHFNRPEFGILTIAICNGAIYLLHVYFYFKALFKLNDASNIECFLGFSVLLVPLLAFFMLGERLSINQYQGIAIALIGVIVLAVVGVKRGSFKYSLITMSGAVIMLSLTFVIQDEIYKHVNFQTGIVLFIVGKVIAALVLWSASECKGVISNCRKFGPLFLFSQLLGVLAVVFFQRAVHISPSVSIVAAIETTTPLFIMLFSIISVFFLSFYKDESNATLKVLKLQFNKLFIKLAAFGCLLIGITISIMPELTRHDVQISLSGLFEPKSITIIESTNVTRQD